MKIGELSERSGLSRDTIRLYEKNGLIASSASKSATNNYREYGEDVLLQLQFVGSARDVGISIADLRELMKAFFDSGDPSEAEKVMVAKVAELKVRIAQIENVISFLDAAIGKVRSGLDGL
ncbi:MerR family transcriptional regulator [Yoonia sp. I 8.24]|uniref:MerR family transcriptional regulator n=1 Tax=Yoonia sp. I 8.24 TaxID=1537229 RepID=UPI001EE044D6|nr:MerR family transcriptional regulator [Yoonia sp. I 8.24]MCG3267935.1 MerR family transcriptional regulator [Yoonia sp. I 8.24]